MTSVFNRLVPSLNRILVKKIQQEAKSKSGIILQEASNANSYGVVIETGPGNVDSKGSLIPLAVKIGDTVLLPDYGGSKINLKGGEFFVFRDTDIIGTLSNE